MPLPIRCIKCGYDLSGLRVEDQCPECGKPIRDVFDVERPTAGVIAAFVLAVLGLIGAFLGGLPGVVFACIALLITRHERIEGELNHAAGRARSWLRLSEAMATLALVGGVFIFALFMLPWLLRGL